MTKSFSEFQIKKCQRRYKMVATLLGILVVRTFLILNRIILTIYFQNYKLNYAGLIRW